MIGRWLRALPLTVRVPLLAAGLMVIVGLVASQQVLLSLAGAQKARLNELVRLHVDGLSVALGPSVLREDVWEVFDTLDRASSEGNTKRMIMTAVADNQGQILAATDPKLAPLGNSIESLAASAHHLDAIEIDASDERIIVQAPLTYQGRRVGVIVTKLDVSDLAAERRNTVIWLLLGNAAATGILALSGYFAMRRMLQPVATLARYMGDGSGRPELVPDDRMPRGNTEVGRLLRTYNSMALAVRAEAEAKRRIAERERFVSLGRLASSLAHEINNPLGGLLNAVDTIGRYADRPEVVRQSASLVERGLRHMRDVSRAALDHNRLGEGEARLKTDDFEDLRLLVRPELERKDQSLSWEIEATENKLACLPAAPIRQITLNLLLNASAAAPRGGNVGLNAALSGDRLALSVEDNGAGLPLQAIERLSAPEWSNPGDGLGLRVVHDLVKELAGDIVHERQKDRTVITVSVPVRLSTEAA